MLDRGMSMSEMAQNIKRNFEAAMAAIADNARAAFGPGQPIPRADALAIARDTLLRAERERLEIADAEAGRGIQYNEDGGLFV